MLNAREEVGRRDFCDPHVVAEQSDALERLQRHVDGLVLWADEQREAAADGGALVCLERPHQEAYLSVLSRAAHIAVALPGARENLDWASRVRVPGSPCGYLPQALELLLRGDQQHVPSGSGTQ